MLDLAPDLSRTSATHQAAATDQATATDQIEADDRLVEMIRRGQLAPDHPDPLISMLAGWRAEVAR